MTGRWKPDERDAGEDDEAMAQAMRAYHRKGRIFFFFVICPVLGIAFSIMPWIMIHNGRPMPNNFWFGALVVAGPTMLWVVAVRLVLSVMMMGDELRTEEEDERQKRLWRLYIRVGGLTEWIGMAIGFIHLVVVFVSF